MNIFKKYDIDCRPFDKMPDDKQSLVIRTRNWST